MKPLLVRFRVRTYVTTLVLLAVVISAVSLKVIWPDRSSPQGAWVKVSTSQATHVLEARGKLAPQLYSELPSPANGNIKSVGVSWGDRVKKGQLLLEIESSELLGQLRTAEASFLRGNAEIAANMKEGEPLEVFVAKQKLLVAESAHQAAISRLLESESLYDRGFIARVDKEQAAADVQNARASELIAEEDVRVALFQHSPGEKHARQLDAENRAMDLRQLQIKLSQLQMVAPIDGVVLPATSRTDLQTPPTTLSAGAKVVAGDPVLAIGDLSEFVVQAMCPEAELSWLRIGHQVQVGVGSLPLRKFAGTLVRFGNERVLNDGQTKGNVEFECVFRFALEGEGLSVAETESLRIGGSATVQALHTDAVALSTVPLAALVWSPDGASTVKWRETLESPPKQIDVTVARAELQQVQLREPLDGFVWVQNSSLLETRELLDGR